MRNETGLQKQRRYAQLCKTTMQITGKTSVHVGRLSKINPDKTTGEIRIDGRIYEAVKGYKSWHLTGDYVTA